MPRSWGILHLSLHSFRDYFLYKNDELPFKHSHTDVWYFSSRTDHYNDQMNMRKKGKQFIFHDFFAFFWYFFAFFGFFFAASLKILPCTQIFIYKRFAYVKATYSGLLQKKKASGTIFSQKCYSRPFQGSPFL